MKGDKDTTVQELKDMVAKFRDERGWAKHHSPKNLAISICLEAAELLEHFQWDDYSQDDAQAIAEELSDIVFNCLNFADVNGIDIASTFLAKFQRAEAKYPVEIFNPTNHNNDEYFRIKKAYRRAKS